MQIHIHPFAFPIRSHQLFTIISLAVQFFSRTLQHTCQLIAVNWLQQIVFCIVLHRSSNKVKRTVTTDNNESGFLVCATQFFHQRDTIDTRHAHIQYDQIELHRLRPLICLFAIMANRFDLHAKFSPVYQF